MQATEELPKTLQLCSNCILSEIFIFCNRTKVWIYSELDLPVGNNSQELTNTKQLFIATDGAKSKMTQYF